MRPMYFAHYRSDLSFTHYLFRFPAKFHPPAVRCLIDRYSKPGDTILDPFCGSGTLLVEALVEGRHAIGVDIDPLACFIARTKSKPVHPQSLEDAFTDLKARIREIRRPSREYDRLIHEDIAPSSISRFRSTLGIPSIPNIDHWFRTYVVLDLARLRAAIDDAGFEPRTRNFFLASFASIIRNTSNADPVPVSGLEVTAHMKALDARGRRIDPFELFERRVKRELEGMRELWDNAQDVNVRVRQGDATALTRYIPSSSVDVVITSPPYNTAVDYYRRHALEMYWLGLIASHEERLALAPKYLGRDQVRESNPRLRCEFESGYINRLIAHARQVSRARERAVTHYCSSMQRADRRYLRTLLASAALMKPSAST